MNWVLQLGQNMIACVDSDYDYFQVTTIYVYYHWVMFFIYVTIRYRKLSVLCWSFV